MLAGGGVGKALAVRGPPEGGVPPVGVEKTPFFDDGVEARTGRSEGLLAAGTPDAAGIADGGVERRADAALGAGMAPWGAPRPGVDGGASPEGPASSSAEAGREEEPRELKPPGRGTREAVAPAGALTGGT